jgi:hypothetical protein
MYVSTRAALHLPAFFTLLFFTSQIAEGTTCKKNCSAKTGPIQIPIIEWDLPQAMDTSPGAMMVDRGSEPNRVWFVTRDGVPRVFQFLPHHKHKEARWTSWRLDEDSLNTGGLKKLNVSTDRRFVFVRTVGSLQRIDTSKCTTTGCERTTWQDQVPGVQLVSDVALDDKLNVYTTAAVPLLDEAGQPVFDETGQPVFDPDLSYVQRTKGTETLQSGDMATVTRWRVGGGAGFCDTAVDSAPCASGIAVHPHPKKQHLIYYSEPKSNKIGELNTYTNTVRRWSLQAVDAREPRQLNIDRDGIVWVVTGSNEIGKNHLVRLDPYNNRLAKFLIPDLENDPFGVAPDGNIIAFSASSALLNKVGILCPRINPICVTPESEPVPPTQAEVPVEVEACERLSNTVKPASRTAPGTVREEENGNGVFVEASLAAAQPMDETTGPSMRPLGVTQNKGGRVGGVFYAVGLNATVNRIGVAFLRPFQKPKHPRDDDDFDDDGKHDHRDDDDDDDDGFLDHLDLDDDNDGEPDDIDDDDDDDGIEDKNDAYDRENEVWDIGELSAGQTLEYPMTAGQDTLILTASIVTDDPLTPVSIEILDAGGLLAASVPPTPGIAAASVLKPAPGAYTIRVRNHGLTSTGFGTTFITRELWPLLSDADLW